MSIGERPFEDTGRRQHLQMRKRVLTGNRICQHLDHGLQPPELWENQCVVYATQTVVFRYGSPSRLRQLIGYNSLFCYFGGCVRILVYIFNLSQSAFKWYYTTSWSHENLTIVILFSPSWPLCYYWHIVHIYTHYKSHTPLLLLLFKQFNYFL